MNIISQVKLENFRTHDKFKLELKNPTTLIIGENGSGKTSLIEALYVSIQGKSFRSRDEDILKKGRKHYKVSTVFSDGRKNQMEYRAETGKKQFTVDDKTYARLPLKNRYPVVLFEPDDLNLLYNSPARRRDWLNRLISSIDEGYHKSLLRYEKALSQRNNVLKSDFYREHDIFAWNVILAEYGSHILTRRKELVSFINSGLQPIYQSIAENSDQTGVLYKSDSVTESDYLKKLTANLEKDKVLGQTTYGPHRDDVEFNFNGELAVNTASRGEIRTIVLSLKFIEAGLIQQELGINPIILLDDIFSELDNTRQHHLTNGFKNHQVIITSVNPPGEMSEDVRL
ncbi:MAG: DNA replication and repair protein RecF [Candidatus Nomurabacteria bacterium]|jgi:DNA replication and repair protein RecF|nr:DNA replication and repair protein RecF [Candidatus Nomurabacteria bacterium]